jgi:single-strand DNA-binding protein
MSKGTLNLCTLIGNLGADPEIRTTTSGMQIGSLRVATVESRKGQSGQWEDETEWHRVTVFGKTAEFFGNYARKGNKVSIVGRIRTRKWQDKDGKDQYTTEIVANDAQILERREGGNAPASQPSHQSSGGGDFMDEIPFMRLHGPW